MSDFWLFVALLCLPTVTVLFWPVNTERARRDAIKYWDRKTRVRRLPVDLDMGRRRER